MRQDFSDTMQHIGLCPSEVAQMFECSVRQIYRIINDEVELSLEDEYMVARLSFLAEVFKRHGLDRHAMYMRINGGTLFNDVWLNKSSLISRLELVIEEKAKEREAAERAPKLRGPATDDWMSELSIPGGPE